MHQHLDILNEPHFYHQLLASQWKHLPLLRLSLLSAVHCVFLQHFRIDYRSYCSMFAAAARCVDCIYILQPVRSSSDLTLEIGLGQRSMSSFRVQAIATTFKQEKKNSAMIFKIIAQTEIFTIYLLEKINTIFLRLICGTSALRS